ncbi:hypothetical protein JHK84_043411 [Glycine max]|nr:hypothetical protein JHK86_043225 [Glycine max]KAG5117298.1 hypothetical protein JHK84_043411 [Glycine max]
MKAAEDTKARIVSEYLDSEIIVMALDLSSLNSVMVGLEVVFGCENGAEVVMEVVFVAVEVGCDGHGDLGQRWSWKCAWERKKKKDKKRDIRNFGGTSSNN